MFRGRCHEGAWRIAPHVDVRNSALRPVGQGVAVGIRGVDHAAGYVVRLQEIDYAEPYHVVGRLSTALVGMTSPVLPHLKPADLIDSTICFWNTKKISSVGRAATVAAAST